MALFVVSLGVIIWKMNFLREDSLSTNSIISTMDSYLIEDGDKKIVYVSSLEMPISLTNKKLAVRAFEISGESLLPLSEELPIAGYHVRSIFQTRPVGTSVYIMDHGLDIKPFPGGSTVRFDLRSKELTTYKEMDGKFNFSGDSYVFQGSKYDVFVGINFIYIYRDGQALDLGDLPQRMADPQGYLSAVLFEADGEIKLFLGISDIYPQNYGESKRFDYLVNLSRPGFPISKIERPVPWNWATVYAAVQNVPGIGKALKVSYHNPGFNEPRLGYYLIDEGFRFQSLPIPPLTDLVNNWVARFEFRGDGSKEVVAHVKSGSGGGKFGALFLKPSPGTEAVFKDICLVGVHQFGSEVYGISCDLRLVKL